MPALFLSCRAQAWLASRRMSWFYRSLIRPALFTQDSEAIHNRTLAALGWAARQQWACRALDCAYGVPELPLELFGLRFPNPVGLAAGMDKQAAAVPVWKSLGFGFSELGGVTWHAQPGNPLPRMFRAVADEALVNRMGFNNGGARVLAERLADWREQGRWPNHPVGINLGKSKVTPLNEAADDYANSLRVLWPHADFFVVNVSSPNTPNLRQLQDKSALDEILAALQQVNSKQARSAKTPNSKPQTRNHPKPILVKVAPDLTFEALDEILELVGPRQLAGIVATNTTIARPATDDARLNQIYAETGGLSGRPLRARSTEVIRHLFRQTKGAVPIIGVGGISCAADAWEKITAGASLVQVYSGLVYEGPGLVRDIVQGLRWRLEVEGLSELRAAVGTKAC
ncbi:MAG: dihydroorotate dehydrogenase (fumarate) [Limisphaerales bacterium]|nr:MAG: dihydroorotate dehydrogenase (fumarate) [Limisphaerales bacterium]KAG0508465.1 MAG: dihydroorotate dehydrogenase (fumarate) [Limisphaerales bacterium]TXT47887.1 MAG: dihydroorotate dehydrogenase (fumarate) [Limisphaerales bacterium]